MKAIIIGATGLVENHILRRLLDREDIRQVLIFVRHSSGILHPKLIEKVVDFERIDKWHDEIRGDILFSALGTTLKAAGSKAAQYRIDYDYQFNVAQAAAKNGVSRYVLISSVNADAQSAFFYLKMKGELEEAVKALNFKSISILRPGPLKGLRKKNRLSEVISVKLLELMPEILVRPGMKPVSAEKVANKSINCGLSSNSGLFIIGPEAIFA